MEKQLNSQKSTARDVFFYLLMIIMLYASVIAFISLLWQYINVQFPDPLEFYYSGAVSIMRNAISSLVVVWPVFIFMSWLINKDLRVDKLKQNTWVRRWLLYLTLFVAAITIIIDLVTLTNSFLSGELTTRFLLKVLVILVVAVVIFWFYMWELRRDASKVSNRHKIAAITTSVIIVGWIVAGFFIVGTPAEQRQIRFDEQRVNNLQSIQYQVVDYWNQKGVIPSDLDDLSSSIGGFVAPTDPLTQEAYEYQVNGPLEFTLCATFAKDSKDSDFAQREPRIAFDPFGAPTKGFDSWEHGEGRVCFDRTIDPELNKRDGAPTPIQKVDPISYMNTSSQEIIVSEPDPGELVTSPLRISGQATGLWYFEAEAPVVLENDGGKVIAEGFVMAQGDWMTEEFVPFEGELEFDVVGDIGYSGTLILKNGNPSENRENDKSVEIPVRF